MARWRARGPATGPAGTTALWLVLAQIAVLDVVFSLDSVITAVGLVDELPVMILAIVIAVLVMMVAARPDQRLRRSTPDGQDARAQLSRADRLHPDRRRPRHQACRRGTSTSRWRSRWRWSCSTCVCASGGRRRFRFGIVDGRAERRMNAGAAPQAAASNPPGCSIRTGPSPRRAPGPGTAPPDSGMHRTEVVGRRGGCRSS